jgi:hypothetical protein
LALKLCGARRHRGAQIAGGGAEEGRGLKGGGSGERRRDGEYSSSNLRGETTEVVGDDELTGSRRRTMGVGTHFSDAGGEADGGLGGGSAARGNNASNPSLLEPSPSIFLENDDESGRIAVASWRYRCLSP